MRKNTDEKWERVDRILERVEWWLLGTGRRGFTELHLMDIEFQFYQHKVKSAVEMNGCDSCTLWMYLTSLNSVFKDSDFMCIIP